MLGARRKPKQGRGHRIPSRGRKVLERDLSLRAPGESLWLRRRQAGLTGPEAALVLGIGRTALWEAEVYGKGAEVLAKTARHRWPEPPGLPQLLALARRRQGWGLYGTARKVGLSHTTLLAAERRGDAWLVMFWEGVGFTFVRRRK